MTPESIAWDTVVFATLVALTFVIYSAGVFMVGFWAGRASSWREWFRKGWDAGAANATNHPNQS